jgi:hypothetical protein
MRPSAAIARAQGGSDGRGCERRHAPPTACRRRSARRSGRAICRSAKSSAGLASRRSSSWRTICCTRRTLRLSEAAMARIDSPPIRRAKIRCARVCSSRKDRTGFAAGADIGLAFDETGIVAQILSTVKDLSKNSRRRRSRAGRLRSVRQVDRSADRDLAGRHPHDGAAGDPLTLEIETDAARNEASERSGP